MYDEDAYRRYLLFVKIKKTFIMIVFCVIGAILGVIISSCVVDVLRFSSNLKPIIIIISTLIFLAIALLATSNASKEVQDGYWKIAVLRKLTLISKKLDNLENLNDLASVKLINEDVPPKEEISSITPLVEQEDQSKEQEQEKDEEIKNSKKSKKSKEEIKNS